MSDDAVVRPDAAEAKARVRQMFTAMAPTYGDGAGLFDVFGGSLVGAAGIRPGDRVLDLACGRGACLRPASDAVGSGGYVLGLDLSAAMVELTAKRLRDEAVANAEVRVGDAEHLDLDDESFDVVVCGFGVFFFPQPAASLETLRVLRPDGRFAASTYSDSSLDYPWLPDILDEMGLLGAMSARSGRGEPMLGADGLARILLSVGFERVKKSTVEHRFVFADVDAYLVWVRSHAFGAIINRLTEHQFHEFREKCSQRLQDHRATDGYEFRKRVDFTVAECC